MPKNRASKYMGQKLIEIYGEIYESTIIIDTLSLVTDYLAGRKSVGYN